MKTIALAAAALALGAGAARAQIALPPLPPPLGGVTQAVPALGERLGLAETLAEARRLQVRALLRTHRTALEADPDGEPIVRRRVLAIGASPAAIEAARAAGFSVDARDDIDGLGALVTLSAPPGMSTARALRRLRRLDPEGTYDFDHLHLPSAAGVGAAAPPPPGGAARVRIGLIDTGVGPALAPAVAAQRSFAGPAAVPGAHGEIVAGLLAAEGGVSLIVADIYGGAPTGGASSALARALAWLAGEGPPVINVSLVGPRNRVVEAVVAQLVGRGFLIVAAVGNDGPAAAPLFPAAYPGVVGVTAVDARERVLVEAGRGPQVDFAAPGVIDGPAPARGTSFAAPIVARALAQEAARPDPAAAARALAAARARARDLGPRGRDDTYGDGLLAAAR
ncbi:MAG: S8 family serine peptidase [Hyphomonadaceae bacterium]|nr:S8 family serine peptidase [Hyphomonadaceae bacterium]